MSYFTETMGNLLHQTAFFNLTWGNFVMILVACIFLYLAIAKGFEPLLLVPIAFGMLLVNIYPDIFAAPAAAGPALFYPGHPPLRKDTLPVYSASPTYTAAISGAHH